MLTRPPTFGGSSFNPKKDEGRLKKQLQAVKSHMLGHGWQTLAQIAKAVEAPEASVSARLRDMRKPKFGAYTIERRRVPGHRALFQYRIGSASKQDVA